MAADLCRQAVRERLITQMLNAVQDDAGGGWRALILDAHTTRILSSALRMSDILDASVSVVEDLDKTREPLALPGIYFITPTVASVTRLLADFQKKPLYPSVHIFFSSSVTADVVDRIKRCAVLLPVLHTLKEVNLEFLLVDGRTISTENPDALTRCMGEAADVAGADFQRELDVISMRLVSVFATLNEFPAVRYRAGRPPEAGDAPGARARHELTLRLAQKVSERAMVLQRHGQLPASPTSDLVILDRSLDPVAPFIHEWTYEALVYDLLPVEDKTISYTGETAGGKQEARQHVLDEADEVWTELRHAHIADVYGSLSRRVVEFQAKNKAAQYQRQGEGAAPSSMNMRALIAALPQFRDVLARLGVHVFMSNQIKDATNRRHLTDVSELEQDLVYGDRNSTDLIKFMQEHGASLDAQDKMRLFICYLATHPEKLDGSKRQQWQKVARLDERDMATICNLAFLNVAVMKQPSAQSKGGLFSGSKKKKATYRKREGREQEKYALARFDPLLQDVVEDAVAGKLSSEEYPYLRPPAEADEFSTFDSARVGSVRTNKRSAMWTRRPGSGADGNAQSGPSAASGGGSGLFSGPSSLFTGRRLVLFVLGGVTRSEMRVVHQLSRAHNREVVLVSTNVLRPRSALGQLQGMGVADRGGP